MITALSIFAARSAKMVLATTIVGGLIGFALFHLHEPRWTARMLVKLGQITTFAESGVAVRPIESQMTAVDQINQPAYRFNVLKNLGLPAPDGGNADATLIFDSLRAAPGRGTDLLAVQVNAHSPELAAKALTASFALIEREHQKMYNDVVERMKKELADTNAKLTVAEQEYAKAYDSLKVSQGRDGPAVRDLFTTNIAATVSRQVIDLQRRKTQLEDSLEPIRTYSTRIMDAPYVPATPSSPGRTVYVGLGALAGLIFGIALFVLTRIRG
ncbi:MULTISPECIES: hypothetical protein [unclassified Cupriavidus]|uniref:hypothetical protein n=1 Tax=unclassified Cupriavidus TaxID=2640874 RepID=UPI00088E4823|nr:hypothetical protein [Cupriavidus sp. YR651]SDC21794.1 Chain length determinant protein [Cupriavidus sp. YR651]